MKRPYDKTKNKQNKTVELDNMNTALAMFYPSARIPIAPIFLLVQCSSALASNTSLLVFPVKTNLIFHLRGDS